MQAKAQVVPLGNDITALALAGAISVADAARLLRLRGQAMQAAVPVGQGAMAAILGLDFATVTQVADAAAQTRGGYQARAVRLKREAHVLKVQSIPVQHQRLQRRAALVPRDDLQQAGEQRRVG